MALGEFELIARYFGQAGARRGDVRLGIGDDGAVVSVPADREVITVVHTLNEPDDDAGLGARALALAARDLLANGAEPAWATLALSLPRSEPGWLGRFAAGLEAGCREHGFALIGGDTTRGPLTVTVVGHGLAPSASGRVPRGRTAPDATEPC